MRVRWKYNDGDTWKYDEITDVLSRLFPSESIIVKLPCKHTTIWNNNGILTCKLCGEQIKVTSYRDLYDKKYMNYETYLPEYAIHTDKQISGFFSTFRFLSNFFPCKVHYDGLDYPSVENAYQSAKYPENQRAQFTICTAAQAKKLGRQAPGFNKKVWDDKKYHIMAILVLQKFLYNKDLKEMLLATEDAVLEERNHWSDRYWGTDENGI